jgi:hypothetical protein
MSFRDPIDLKAIEWARSHLDLSKNLNDQGYFGPTPNEADPRTVKRTDEIRPEVLEYYTWVDAWIVNNNGMFDNIVMAADRLRYLMAERRRLGYSGPFALVW